MKEEAFCVLVGPCRTGSGRELEEQLAGGADGERPADSGTPGLDL
ncbi:hypothetical protein APY03_0687 [Variovorax sp. WDL1]|nr:hypothetical protein APY03_0687 [Variovorax sp. WDL1]